MSGKKFLIDESFEKELLSGCLRSTDLLKKAVRLIRPHHFATPEREWIWEKASKHWVAYHERPTLKYFQELARREFPKEEKRKPYLIELRNRARRRAEAPEAALEAMQRFAQMVDYHRTAEMIVKGLEDENPETLAQAFQDGTRIKRSRQTYKHIAWFDGFEERQAKREYEAKHPEDFVVIPTGLGSLDRILLGGGRIGEVCLAMATTGRGKSVMMNNLGLAALKKKFSVAHLAFEMPADQVATRADASWSGLKYEQFKRFSFAPSELRALKNRTSKMMSRFKNKYHILSWPVRSASIIDVHGALDDLESEFAFKPDLVIVDSGDHLMATSNNKESFRLQQSEVYWQMKQLAEERSCLLWSSTHAGREWAEKMATAEASSESYDKSRIADLVITINDPDARGRRMKLIDIKEDEDDEEEVEGYEKKSGIRRLKINVAKYRDGESQFSFDCDADFSRMRIREKKKKDKDEEEEEVA